MSTIPKLSEGIHVNAPYLRKVIDKLRESEIVGAQRGTGGGIYLMSDPAELTMLDVLNAVEPLKRIESCPLGRPDHLKLCPLHSELDEAIGHIRKLLSSRTIAELLTARRNHSRCGFPKLEELCQLQ